MAGQHVDGHLEILQSGHVQREHVGKRVVAGRDERIEVLRETGFGEKGSRTSAPPPSVAMMIAALGPHRSDNDTSAQMRRYTSYTLHRT